MINFNDGWSSRNEYLQISKSEIKDLIKNIMKKNPYGVNATHGGLGLDQIKEIISYLMYVEDNSSVEITIDKEFDEYHLSLTINKKEK